VKFAVLDANAYWTEQLFSACGRFADVLLLKPRDFRAHFRLHRTMFSDRTPREVAPHVWEQRLSMPPGWMFSLWPWAARSIAKQVCRFAGNEPLVLVICYPQYRSIVRLLRPTISVYYNLDDYSDNWPTRAAVMPEWEKETIINTDLTICIARHRMEQLRTRFPEKAEDIVHLPLGSTPEFMVDRHSSQDRAIPESLSCIPSPRFGHIGALNWRFDHGFLAEVARLRPDVQFVLGGKIPTAKDGDAKWQEGLLAAKKLSNIHFIGWIDHSVIGNYLNAFDALFMCYSNCRFNINACPAKLWDYLGSSRPIVANDRNPETLLWREVIGVGATPEAFAQAIDDALTEQGTELPARRLEIARSHTWEQLSHRLEHILHASSPNLCQ
jgi:hypothetical protein